MKRKGRLAGVLILLAVLAGLALVLRPSPVKVEVGRVERGPFTLAVEEDGKTRVRDRYRVNAPLTAVLTRSLVKAGAPVDVGTLLATLQPVSPPLLDERTRRELEARVRAADAARVSAEAAVARAEASHRFAQAELERARQLERQQALPSRERERAETELQVAARSLEAARSSEDQALHDLEQARAALSGGGRPQAAREQWELRSPVQGRVLRVLRESEGFVPAGEPLFELGDPRRLEVVVDVLSTDAVLIHEGDAVEFLQWGGPPLEGRVRLVEPSAVTKVSALGVEEQRVDVLIDLTSPPERWQTLGDGYRVEARIVVQQVDNVVKVPASALFREGGTWAVFAITNGRAHKRQVEAGTSNGLETIIQSGLAPGDIVILHPGDNVRDGTRVAFDASLPPDAR